MDAGSNDEEVAMDTPKVLPDQLLSESYSASETVTMTTVDNEQYTCLLPDLSGERTHRVRKASGRLLSSAVHVWQLQVVNEHYSIYNWLNLISSHTDLSGERTHRVRKASGRLLSSAVHVWQLQVVSQWEVAKRCSTCVAVAGSKPVRGC